MIPHGPKWELTTEYENYIQNCDLAIVCVPTPVDEKLLPDVSAIKSALDSIIKSINNDSKTKNKKAKELVTLEAVRSILKTIDY